MNCFAFARLKTKTQRDDQEKGKKRTRREKKPEIPFRDYANVVLSASEEEEKIIKNPRRDIDEEGQRER
jgi:hypothetical protein